MTLKRFNFGAFPVIETDHLRLREITKEDAPALFDLRSDYEVTKYNIGPAYTKLTQAIHLIKRIHDAYTAQREIRWAITHFPNPILIGMVGFNYWDRTDNRGSIGFDLRRDYWGQGIMTEAVTAVLHFGFQHMHLNRIEADTSAYNTASAALLRRLGFSQEGHQREQYFENGTYHDLLLFALLHKDWQAR